MSIEDWHSQHLPWSTLAPEALPDGLPPAPASRLSNDLAALTRVLLGITVGESPTPEPPLAREEPSVHSAPVPRAAPPLVDLSPTEHPLAPDGHQRLRSVLAELAFLDD